MMDVTVHNSSIGTARVTIDLGAGHKLHVATHHATDSFREVRVDWEAPAHSTGPRDKIVDHKKHRLLRGWLGLRHDDRRIHAERPSGLR